jgi:hypothetical protein
MVHVLRSFLLLLLLWLGPVALAIINGQSNSLVCLRRVHHDEAVAAAAAG